MVMLVPAAAPWRPYIPGGWLCVHRRQVYVGGPLLVLCGAMRAVLRVRWCGFPTWCCGALLLWHVWTRRGAVVPCSLCCWLGLGEVVRWMWHGYAGGNRRTDGGPTSRTFRQLSIEFICASMRESETRTFLRAAHPGIPSSACGALRIRLSQRIVQRNIYKLM